MMIHTQGRPRTRIGRRGFIAERLRKVRAHLGVTQKEVAITIGVAPVTLARWETGSSRPRGLARRFVELWIADALGEEVNLGT